MNLKLKILIVFLLVHSTISDVRVSEESNTRTRKRYNEDDDLSDMLKHFENTKRQSKLYEQRADPFHSKTHNHLSEFINAISEEIVEDYMNEYGYTGECFKSAKKFKEYAEDAYTKQNLGIETDLVEYLRDRYILICLQKKLEELHGL
jgi:hypothetical protein